MKRANVAHSIYDLNNIKNKELYITSRGNVHITSKSMYFYEIFHHGDMWI